MAGSPPAAAAPSDGEPAGGLSLGPLSDQDAAFYTVGQAGDLLGVPAATLRRLDSSGAVSPDRSAGGQRRYSRRQLERAVRLLRLVDDGLTLAGAQRVAALEDEVTELRTRLDARDE